jgi:hydroxymethylpyrimidine pyrophosphatase-like HAD family hydrolase
VVEEMVGLFTDLDNTMIYSKRRNVETSKVCVEFKNGEPLSYMTDTSLLSMMELISRNDLDIIPITTRTVKQFSRLKLPKFRYVLLENGGVLIRDGIPDVDWYNESLSYAEECKQDLENAMYLLKTDKNVETEIKFIDDLFVFVKSIAPNKTMKILQLGVNQTKVDVCSQGNKIYVFPKKLSKGYAVKRFCNRKEYRKIISCGDAPLDFSMANSSDVFITSNSSCVLGKYESIIIVSKNSVFSDEILDYVKETIDYDKK